MDPETPAASRAELNRLLDEALDRPPDARAAWLEALDPKYSHLKEELREMLARAARIETGEFLNTLPKLDLPNAGADPAQSSADRAGERVGAYRLLREIGHGGMGTVWLAERADGLLTRRVALKLPHGYWRAPGLAERMERERAILAELDHRNIAKLFDAGLTPEGQPFLALEYIEGVPIDVFVAGVDGRPELSLPERLRLFLQVANAVAYAHGKLVVHRDLKPANILVSADGGAHLLDFGIAKLLDAGEAHETRLTELSGRALTLDYASPEQILGKPLTVASDVYSLGVILFELLTGARPHKAARNSAAALEQAILETEPPRASQHATASYSRALRGDLDTILAKALKKAPQERYATVNALADDITRHLQQRPVLARPDSAAYRLRKFVARNRGAVAAGVVIASTVMAGAGVAIWQAVEAKRERDLALQQQTRSDAYSSFISVLLQDAGGGAAGQTLSATGLLDRGVAMLEKQTGLEDSVAAYIWYDLSRNYLLFLNSRKELELLERASSAALRIGDQNLYAASECSAAWSMAQTNAPDPRARFERGRAALASSARPADFAAKDCLRAEARLLRLEGDIPRAVTVVLEGRQHLSNESDRNVWRNDPLNTELADLYRWSDRYKDALPMSEAMVEQVRASGRGGSFAEIVAVANMSGNLYRLGEIRRSMEFYEQTLQWVKNTDMTALPPVGLRTNASRAAARLEQWQLAVELGSEDERLATQTGGTISIGLAQIAAAKALLGAGRLDEARRQILKAETLFITDPTKFRRMLVDTKIVQAEIDLAQGNSDSARARVAEELLWIGYPANKQEPGIDHVLRVAATVNMAVGDHQAALGYANDAFDAATRIAREPTASADVGLAALLRAEILDLQGKPAEARRELDLAVPALKNGYGESHSATRRALKLATSLGAQTS
jgi:eukaryotic-like serine/threonine-protein kinase